MFCFVFSFSDVLNGRVAAGVCTVLRVEVLVTAFPSSHADGIWEQFGEVMGTRLRSRGWGPCDGFAVLLEEEQNPQ